ncbi:MAG: YwiC-like family protein [Candidatus Latescibacteria bacterium]|nr:YwiC-like family protein [Candidatus Latescibacterota bacterium]MBT4141031.1 YwiC-like family protein [Candidatus Latescibacterota bacterium]
MQNIHTPSLMFTFTRPPIPQEHGAWFMLYVPLITILISLNATIDSSLVLILTVTGAFFGQHATILFIRNRAPKGTGLWLLIYSLLFAVGCIILLSTYALFDLIYIGTPAAIALFWLFIRSRFARKRIDRTFSGEILAIAGLSLTAPAAAIVATGHLSQTAMGLWGLYVLFFGSSVLYVKMRILAVQKKSGITFKDRITLGSGLIIYHIALLANVFTFHITTPLLGKYLLVGFAPIIIRAIIGWIRLSNTLPNLQRVGLIESIYTLWFSVCLIKALQIISI